MIPREIKTDMEKKEASLDFLKNLEETSESSSGKISAAHLNLKKINPIFKTLPGRLLSPKKLRGIRSSIKF